MRKTKDHKVLQTHRSDSELDKSTHQGLRALVIILWLIIAFYFGVAGWIKFEYSSLIEQSRITPSKPIDYQGVTFNSIVDLLAYLQHEQAQNTVFYWIFQLPSPLPLLISTISFGLLGSLATIFRRAFVNKELPDLYSLLMFPPLGGLTALMLLGASYLLPSSLSMEGNILLRPTSQLFVSLFAGAFSEHIHRWFQSIMDKIFKIRKEKN